MLTMSWLHFLILFFSLLADFVICVVFFNHAEFYREVYSLLDLNKEANQRLGNADYTLQTIHIYKNRLIH